ncbi:tyrosine-protein kinase hopscotch [Lycorma delicatula]|uniref:tyrosine-protein kinase hopscotch n=1 Tax=Lycorma delicatula TaxID=130591 RepID=UPI003F51A6DB
MDGRNSVTIYTALDTNNGPRTIVIDIFEETTAEDAVVKCCQILKIGPVARHLFALKLHTSKEFVSSGVSLLKSNLNEFDLRLRYKVPSVERLGEIDFHAYEYYFHQVRIDVLNSNIPDFHSDSSSQSRLLGLGVTDMYRVMLDTGASRESVENNYKKYIPKEVLKRHNFFVKKPIRESMAQIVGKNNVRNVRNVMNIYLKFFKDLAPNYLTEEYNAFIEDGTSRHDVVIKVDPYHEEFPGVRYCYERKSEWNHLCSIEDLCYISVNDNLTIEISRKTGIPIYIRFYSVLSMASFISLLDGYYRFSVKWTFNLCKDLRTPSLERLYSMKCHGPVGGEFSYAKLEEKRSSKPGCFILRESETKYDMYYLDVCTNQSSKPTTYEIEMVSEENFVFSGDGKSYPSVLHLIMILRAPDNPIQLQECLPPSENDQSPLLLCKVNDSLLNDSSLNSIALNITSGPPRCIDTKQLQVYKGRRRESWRDMLVMYKGVWRYHKNKKTDVTIKVLKAKHESNLSDLLELAGKWAFLDSGAVVKLFGITLMSPVSMVTEYFHLGSLDIYLHEHKETIKEVDLVEAGTYLATAIWHMEEAGIVHGNIRCSKLLVSAHTDNSFSVRLSDPGLPTAYENDDIHWIPVEWHGCGSMEGARKSITADMWAVGTTLWEIFSFGESPPSLPYEKLISYYARGNRLHQPEKCSYDIYNLIRSCWDADPDRRKKPHEAMRDINQILYQVFNSRRTHPYSTIISNNVKKISRQISDTPSTVDDLDSFLSIFGGNASKNNNNLPLLMGGGSVNEKGSCNESTWLLADSKDDQSSPDMSSTVFSVQFDIPTTTTTLDSMASIASIQSILELDGEYTVILDGRIGQGFYGEVYKGRMDPVDGNGEQKTVAVKKLKSGSIATSLLDFEREISIMKRLKHPNIVEIKGIIQEPEISLVMEFVQHGSLQCYLKIYKEKLNPENLLKFSLDIAQGMEYLGTKNIVHRDLAARNILVASDNQVKISDFGLAQVMGSNNYYILKTSRELPVKWYAPESLESGKFSTRSDVWSYGVTLFEMFSYGEDPCLSVLKDDSELDQAKLLMALKSGARLPCPPTCPQNIYVDIISPCWKYDSHMRISFAELSEQIKLFQNS